MKATRDHDARSLAETMQVGWSPRSAAGVAGLVAGVAYLGVQMGFSTVLGLGGALASLQRIAAILLGPDALAPDPGPTDLAMGLLIHLPLSLLAGYFIGHMVRSRYALTAAAIGAVIGLVFYGLAFYVIAPSAFPWFVDVRNAATGANHMMFGAITGYLAIALQRMPSSRLP
jgi:hypothetical protein